MINYLHGNFPGTGAVMMVPGGVTGGVSGLDRLAVQTYTLFTLGEAMPESPGVPGDPLNLIWLIPAEERKELIV